MSCELILLSYLIFVIFTSLWTNGFLGKSRNMHIYYYGRNSVQNEYNSLLAKNTMHVVHRQQLITFLSNNKIQSNTYIILHRNLTLDNAKLRFFIYDTSISTITCEDAHEKTAKIYFRCCKTYLETVTQNVISKNFLNKDKVNEPFNTKDCVNNK